MKSFRVKSALALLTMGFAVSAQSLAVASADEAAKPDAAGILSKAADLVDIQGSGGAPFLLLANVTLRENNKTVDGIFAMTSASSGQYRRVFRFPGFTSTEVLTGGVIYRQRSSEALPLMIWELDQLLALVPNYRPTPQWNLRRVQTERSGSTDLTCVLREPLRRILRFASIARRASRSPLTGALILHVCRRCASTSSSPTTSLSKAGRSRANLRFAAGVRER